ncbi:MAG: hypothetical protein HY567_03985 [Candidatus Kerfeldbacteria bacterium]|nr:hypothetical protein [Candidatus Kerfeldbacteria bacterium]
MAKPKNTVERGRIRWIVFREGDTWYGVALEFNLVVEADHPQTALFELHSAIEGYLEAVKSARMRPIVLNQQPDFEYALLWKLLNAKRVHSRSGTQARARISPQQVFSFGTVPQHA